MRWIGGFDNFNRDRTSPELFISSKIQNTNYNVISGDSLYKKNVEFPDRYLLLKKIDNEHGRVQDFGDFIERNKIENLLMIHTLNSKYIGLYSHKLMDFIQIVNRWLDLTNGEFIIENNKMFEIKPSRKIGHSI